MTLCQFLLKTDSCHFLPLGTFSRSTKMLSKKSGYPETTILDSSWLGASSRTFQSSLHRGQCNWTHLEPSWPWRPAAPPAEHRSGLCMSMTHGTKNLPAELCPHSWPTTSWGSSKMTVGLSISQSSRCSLSPHNGPQISMRSCCLLLSDLIFDIPLSTLLQLHWPLSLACSFRVFPGDPVVKNLPSSVGDVDLIPSQGTHCPGATRPMHCNFWSSTCSGAYVPQLGKPAQHNERPHLLQLRPDTAKNI